MKVVWIARAEHTDDAGLDVLVVGVSKEAAERACREAVDASLKDLGDDPEELEMNREMYFFHDAYSLPVDAFAT